MAISVKGNTSSVVHGKGDLCLKINPFDNFRLFTLYEDWRNDDRKPLDLSGNQKLYLVFKSKNKEIRIPEYDAIDSDYTVDKVNGQVLFKISKKNAVDILAMNTKVFYITRIYEITDGISTKVTSSEEEVLYSGKFKDETSSTIDNYTSQIKSLLALLDEKNKQIQDLQKSNANLISQNANFATKITDLQSENEKLSSQMSDLEAKVAEYESGTEYTGTVLDNRATSLTYIRGFNGETGKEYTEEEMKNMLKNFELDVQE